MHLYPTNAPPAGLFESAEAQWRVLLDTLVESERSLLDNSGIRDEALRVMACSDFVSIQCQRRSGLLPSLVAERELEGTQGRTDYAERVREAISGSTSLATLMPALRRQRQREMVRIAWRDISGRTDLATTLADLSALADAVIAEPLRLISGWCEARWGVPRDGAGQRQKLVVVAMGKLGARELNFSSDIDLILAFAEGGETDHPRRPLSNEEFFTRLSRQFIEALDKVTGDGFVFRVDTRLRPFGSSGPLCMSYGALEAYYQAHGRDWERYAWIKARVVCGDDGGELMQQMRPFVYRRYLDFSAYESLREMKGLIEREVRQKGLQDDVKRGPGGIREVEFIAQAFQLIRGGQEPQLREASLPATLNRLARRSYLPEYSVAELQAAYAFLRMTEHRLQEVDDRQTQALPSGKPARLRLAYSLGFASWEAFLKTLLHHRGRVDNHFRQLMEAPQDSDAGDELLGRIWRAELDRDEARRHLGELGYERPDDALDAIQALAGGTRVRAMSSQGRQRLDRLMPMLLAAATTRPTPNLILARLLRLVEAVVRRSVYLALLIEHPLALSQLVRLFGQSPWVAEQITKHPLLLDELLDPRSLYHPPDRSGLEREADDLLGRLSEADLEQEMELLRRFKQINLLRIAAAELHTDLAVTDSSQSMSELADVLVERALALTWRDMLVKHGAPGYQDGGAQREAGFLIVGYGKMGGMELGYGSDLDMIFIHDSHGERQQTDGDRVLDNHVFFQRLAQRIIHVLQTPTAGGVLYEVDPRLRPGGQSGLLVSSLEAFRGYQHEEAWTWEHQALVRARPIAGSPGLAARFNAIRAEVLGRQRERDRLRAEVRDMRQRMRDELGSQDPTVMDLKHDAGGIADIEFMVQYGVLLWGHVHPALIERTDTIGLLEIMSRAGLIASQDSIILVDAYRRYRARSHTLNLQGLPARVPAETFEALRYEVSRLWNNWLIG